MASDWVPGIWGNANADEGHNQYIDLQRSGDNAVSVTISYLIWNIGWN